MPLPLIAGLAIGAGSLAAGALGYFSQMSAQERAEAMQDKAIRQWLSVKIPDPEKQKLALEEFVIAGKLTPELETAIKQEPSAFEKITENARLKASRMRSLRSLEELGTGAETFNDKAAQAKALIDASAKARGAQKAIVGNLAERGQLGSGLELTARLDQAQADADRAASNALDIESQRRARALKAIEGAGGLAGNIAEDEYRMKSDKARAADLISNFNTKNMQDVQTRNIAAKNKANEFNLNTAQEIANKNTALRNYEDQYNKELAQKRFENEATVAAGKSGQYNQAANREASSGTAAAKFWGNMAGNIPKVGTAIGDYFDDEDEEQG